MGILGGAVVSGGDSVLKNADRNGTTPEIEFRKLLWKAQQLMNNLSNESGRCFLPLLISLSMPTNVYDQINVIKTVAQSDRIVASEWLRKFEHPVGSGDEDNTNNNEKTDTDAESISTPDWPVRNHCIRLLLIMLQNRQLIGVFRHRPDRETDLLDLTSIYANDIETMLAGSDFAGISNLDCNVGDDEGESFRFAGRQPQQNAALSMMALAPGHQRVWQSPEQRAAIINDAYRPFMLGEWQQSDRQWRAPLHVPRTVYSEITIDEGHSGQERQPTANLM